MTGVAALACALGALFYAGADPAGSWAIFGPLLGSAIALALLAERRSRRRRKVQERGRPGSAAGPAPSHVRVFEREEAS